ncbi:MAG: ABC transporter ATP-binding protein [Dehalococcoidia bacterium]
MDDIAVEVEGVDYTYAQSQKVHALRNISFKVNTSEFVSFIGPSGCGKSTLLHLISGLLNPSKGVIHVNGQKSSSGLGRVAFMPQRDTLFPWRTVEKNAVLGAEILGIPRQEALQKASALFDLFGLSGFEKAWPSELSGGMRQRLALLRTFIIPRDTILLDEPFGSLDALTRHEMQQWLQQIWDKDRRTIILVTHDVDEAILLSDTIYILSERPGSIVQRVEINLERPRKKKVINSIEFTKIKSEIFQILGSEI